MELQRLLEIFKLDRLSLNRVVCLTVLVQWGRILTQHLKSTVKQNQTNQNRSFLSYTGMAFQMIVTILVGTFLGRFIDAKTNSKFPVFTLIGILGGIALSLFRVFQSLKQKK